jgi:hypothetical protein
MTDILTSETPWTPEVTTTTDSPVLRDTGHPAGRRLPAWQAHCDAHTDTQACKRPAWIPLSQHRTSDESHDGTERVRHAYRYLYIT